MMRIAVLADSHGNIYALEAVLADLNHQTLDWVVFNGDYINRGAHSRACLEAVANYQHPTAQVAWLLGNHDALISKWHKRDPELNPWYPDPLFAGCEVAAQELDANHYAWIDALPMEFSLEEVGLRVNHGSPRHFREGIDTHLPRESYIELTQQYPAKVYVGSHTHQPYLRPENGALFLNSGAVGSPFNADPRAQYMLLHLSEQHTEYQFKAISYNRQAARASFLASDLVHQAPVAAAVFLAELDSARSVLTPYGRWCGEQQCEATLESLARYALEVPVKFKEI